MRLLRRQNDATITRTENHIVDIPQYAILSHTWGADHDEVSFDDFTLAHDGAKSGYRKIRFCGQRAELDGIQHFWIDTCCIDKANHTELSEAITSMYRWYKNAEKCYVYLADVSVRNDTSDGARQAWEATFCRSRWFTRGWTLQELLAPKIVQFFSQEGEYLGDKASLEPLIREATNIPVEALRGASLMSFSVEERMSWASRRRTMRKEDEAYCLLGLFGVFIPLIYGEEGNAFIRLQKAIDERAYEEQLNSIRKGLSSKHDQITDSLGALDGTDELDSAILQTLAFPEMHNRRLNIEPRHQHTCEWILNTTEYKQWTSDSYGLFWVKGKPGAGKSTVMAFLYDQLMSNAKHNPQNSPSIQLDFFFNARGTELQHTFRGMLRSLLHQLFLHDVSTSHRIRTIFSDRKRSFGNSPTSWEWQLNELKSLFVECVIAAGKQKSLLIFVDALDEAGELSARQIAQYFHQINGQAVLARALVKICISCRHYPIITSKKISLEIAVEEHNNDDIAAFVRDTLCLDEVVDYNSPEAYIWQALEAELNQRAQGVFQWVHLVIPLVQRRVDRGESPQWIQQKLQDVPDELRDVYVHILQNVIDREDRSLSFLLFQWVCLAAQPLTITEMRYALNNSSQNQMGQGAIDTHAYGAIDTDERMRLRIKPLSGGLLEVVGSQKEKAKYVQVGHQSVNDFMLAEGLSLFALLVTSTSMLPDPSITMLKPHDLISRCHGTLYRTCLSYLLSDDVLSEKTIDRELYRESRSILQRLPFLRYGILQIFVHAEKAGAHRSSDLLEEIKMLQRVAPLWVKCYRALDWYGPHSPNVGTRTIHIAARANMIDVVERLLLTGCDVHLRDGVGQTAMHLAAQNGHLELAIQLTKFEVDVNVTDDNSATALVCATNEGRVPMAQWLLKQGAQIAPSANLASDAFYTAASKGHIELIRLFISAKAELGVLNCRDAIRIASLQGHEEAVQVILDNRAKVKLQTSHLGEALIAASSSGHERIVQKLLVAGAGVNWHGARHTTPLQAAAFGGHAKVVQLLLDKGADVNMKAGQRGTALHSASLRGHEDIVSLLLSRGADVNVRAGEYDTVLQAASIGGYLRLVSRFLYEGAAVNATGGRYNTALQAAAFSGKLLVVQALLDKGADVTVEGGFFGNALRAAVVGGHEEILCRLVAKSSLHEPLGRTGSPMAYKHLF